MRQSQPFLFAQAVCDADDPGHANTVTHPYPYPDANANRYAHRYAHPNNDPDSRAVCDA
jgi:hypothetical protein